MKHVQSVIANGNDGLLVDVECQLSNGLPIIILVGLGNKAVDESKERLRGAFVSAGIRLPRKRITINLAPADIPKESTSLDMTIAASILVAEAQDSQFINEKVAFMGEIGLDGGFRAIRGIIGKVIGGKKLGIETFVVPIENYAQAKLVPNVKIIPLHDLNELQNLIIGGRVPEKIPIIKCPTKKLNTKNIFNLVIGQEQAKRALAIAAAGGHNILLTGPPGTGKSMLAKAFKEILPPLTVNQILEVTHLHSLANKNFDEIITERPFRSPHHNASHVSIVGGGSDSRPGEITLSHHGVLFLDEFPEFNRQTIEALRQPLEDHTITVARAKQTLQYPANFLLIATANPCPCGFYGSTKTCVCSAAQINRYQQKLSGPILDRIDLHSDVSVVEHEKLLSIPTNTGDEQIKKSVLTARQKQFQRFNSREKLNSEMSNKDLTEKAKLSPDAKQLLDTAAQKLNISARSYMKLAKVARTIADLEDNDIITPEHMSEALQYRSINRLQD